VTGIRTSLDGKLLVTPTGDGKVRLWEMATGRKVVEVSVSSGSVPVALLLPDGRTLLVGQWGGVRAWDLAAGKERGWFRGHQGDVLRMTLSPDGRLLATGSSDTTALLWDVTALPAVEGLELTAKELDGLWADLGGEAEKAYPAVWRLSASPGQSLSYLGEKLRPVGEPDAKRVTKLIGDLASEDFAVRKAATAELEKLGPLAAPALGKSLADDLDVDVQLRIRALLSKADAAEPSGERLRLVRAVQAVEGVGTAEGKALLDKLAAGAESAHLTVEAKQAAERLGRRLGK
jgi:hypothetical protein